MPNRLAHAQSLYLRKHADNPIDWWAWTDDAIATARRDNKPIFLSIGYSSCHWCTVMEGEAFSNLAIADYMNANFLPIKVDREERPDIDSIYMQALQLMVGQGGWPLNVFLSPDDLVPFYGGTYFPVEPRYGRPGFLQVLQTIRRFYDVEKTKVQSVKDDILSHLQQAASVQVVEELGETLLRQGLESSTGVLTYRGGGPSFPMIPYAEAALRAARFNFPEARYDALEICQQRGLDLALGGIYDHVGGGFHRYTVDGTWTVPHFEKMLYDNGQIVEYLANLWSVGVQEPAFERSIAGTVAWLKREMTAPSGYFYAAQDADSFATADEVEPEEGAFYVWNHQQLAQRLTPEELAELVEQFTVSTAGNFEGKNVLQRRHPGQLSDSIEAILEKLFVDRYGSAPAEVPTFSPARTNTEAKTHPWTGRIPAVTDTKMIVAWNSLMIAGLARAAIVFQKTEYLELANRAARFILDHQIVNGRLHRLNYAQDSAEPVPQPSEPAPSADAQPTIFTPPAPPYTGKASVLAQSEDYALLIKALLDLNQAAIGVPLENPTLTTELARSLVPSPTQLTTAWLDEAIQLQAEFDEHLWSVELGGYYNTDAQGDLVVRERSFDDNALPSANGVAIANLVRLFLLTEDLQYLDRAEQALQAFSGVMNRAAQSCPTLFVALDWFRNQTLVRTEAATIPALMAQSVPTTGFKATALPPETVGLVCQGLSCKEPAKTLGQLQTQLQQSVTRSAG